MMGLDIVKCKNCGHRLDRASIKHIARGRTKLLVSPCHCGCNKPQPTKLLGKTASMIADKYFPEVATRVGTQKRD